ncbi:MAG: FtsX-like permease family protein [Proteobacteria bacterium]|nr:FtsX-like permease family protein [Pseudomonadota bacterium]
MKLTRTDIHFSGDDAHAFLPWVVGIMACIATLMLCFGITVGGWIVDRGGSYANNFTVNIPSLIEDLPQKTVKIMETLEKTPGVASVKQESEESLRDMLKPWLGSGTAVEALPLPIVVEVIVREDAEINTDALEKSLAAIAPGTELDTHEQWIANFMQFSSAVRSTMTLLASLVIFGLGLMIAFMCRASLKLHSRTVNLLHSIGAEDIYIARQFQSEACFVTLLGTVPGCIIAGVAYWLTGICAPAAACGHASGMRAGGVGLRQNLGY